MNAKSAAEILGTEYDWLGCDGAGHVALFSTAGGSYAPEEFLSDTDLHAEAIEAILASPATTSARFAPEVAPGCVNTWLLVADRGLFAFDGDANGGPYQLVAAPETPVRATSLPMPAADALRRLRFHWLRFAELVTVSERILRQGQ